MTFSEFSKYLGRLDNTTKRLEITAILEELIKKLTPEEVAVGCYLSLGYLKASYENPKFNIAERMMLRILSAAYNTDQKTLENIYNKNGDLGDTTYEIAQNKNSNIQITELHEKLLQLADIEGGGSQDAKVVKMANILEKLDNLSAKYVVRIVLGTTRLGFTELTVIAALNKLIDGNKETEAEIELTYNVHPDIGLIAKQLKEHGLKGIKKIGIELGVPIMPQRCQRLSDTEDIIEKMGKVSAEYKFDGTRVQLHMDRKRTIKSTEPEQNALFGPSDEKIFVKTYTRNLEETTYQYPDLVEGALSQIKADSIILDGEAIGYNKDTGEFLPFQEIMQRKRKHGIAEMAKDIPLKYFVFDILYLNGEDLTNKTLEERRKILRGVINAGNVLQMDNSLVTDNAGELNDFFEESKEKGLEGIVIKKIDAPYQAGARAFTWVKLKRSETALLKDTIDVVILGYYFGKGSRAEFGLGGFLAGVYDKNTDSYKTITKVGTGLKEEDLINLKREADKIKTSKKPTNLELNKAFEPDVWISPKIVVELGADEVSKSATHSAGYALRFPRLLKFRPDKKPEDTTSLTEIIDIYDLQKRGSY